MVISDKFQFSEQMTTLSLQHIALIYLAVICSSYARLLPTGRKNVVTFFVYGIDKFQIALLIFIYKNL